MQTGAVVTGTYHNWGVTYGDLEGAGTISGAVTGSVFTGSYSDKANDVSGTVTWTLSNQGSKAATASAEWPPTRGAECPQVSVRRCR